MIAHITRWFWPRDSLGMKPAWMLNRFETIATISTLVWIWWATQPGDTLLLSSSTSQTKPTHASAPPTGNNLYNHHCLQLSTSTALHWIIMINISCSTSVKTPWPLRENSIAQLHVTPCLEVIPLPSYEAATSACTNHATPCLYSYVFQNLAADSPLHH